MRLTIRLLIPLAILLGFIALTFLPIIDRQATQLLTSEDENIKGIAYCAAGKERPVYQSPKFPKDIDCLSSTNENYRIAIQPVMTNGKSAGTLMVVHDIKLMKEKVRD